MGLDSQKYVLNTSIYVLKLVQLLFLSVFEPYEERSRHFVRNEDTAAAQSSLPILIYCESIRWPSNVAAGRARVIRCCSPQFASRTRAPEPRMEI